MDNQKDTVKYQKDNNLVTEINSLNIKVFSSFLIKKTEKLVTALYMVTDCMEVEDAMKIRLRTLGVGLLSNSHSFTNVTSLQKQALIETSQISISEIISLVEIASMMGFVSEMNATILRKEFGLLQAEITRFKEGDTTTKNIIKKTYSHEPAVLDEESFSVPLPIYKDAPVLPSQFWQSTANPYKGHIKDNTAVLYNTPKNNKIATSNPQNNSVRKEERTDKMLALIKIKKEVSIKDISGAFIDCSEKTIQRELNNLVAKGQLKKIGSKRWSRYQYV